MRGRTRSGAPSAQGCSSGARTPHGRSRPTCSRQSPAASSYLRANVQQKEEKKRGWVASRGDRAHCHAMHRAMRRRGAATRSAMIMSKHHQRPPSTRSAIWGSMYFHRRRVDALWCGCCTALCMRHVPHRRFAPVPASGRRSSPAGVQRTQPVLGIDSHRRGAEDG